MERELVELERQPEAFHRRRMVAIKMLCCNRGFASADVGKCEISIDYAVSQCPIRSIMENRRKMAAASHTV